MAPGQHKTRRQLTKRRSKRIPPQERTGPHHDLLCQRRDLDHLDRSERPKMGFNLSVIHLSTRDAVVGRNQEEHWPHVRMSPSFEEPAAAPPRPRRAARGSSPWIRTVARRLMPETPPLDRRRLPCVRNVTV